MQARSYACGVAPVAVAGGAVRLLKEVPHGARSAGHAVAGAVAAGWGRHTPMNTSRPTQPMCMVWRPSRASGGAVSVWCAVVAVCRRSDASQYAAKSASGGWALLFVVVCVCLLIGVVFGSLAVIWSGLGSALGAVWRVGGSVEAVGLRVCQEVGVGRGDVAHVSAPPSPLRCVVRRGQGKVPSVCPCAYPHIHSCVAPCRLAAWGHWPNVSRCVP